MRILDREAERWIDAEDFRRLEKRIGMRLVAIVVAVGSDAVKPVGERMPLQMTLDGGPRRTGGNGARQPQLVEQIEQLPHAGLQDLLRIGQRVEMKVDMYGRSVMFPGRITGFTMGTGSTLAVLPAENATGNFIKVVQRLPVRIEPVDYDPEKSPLFVGLSVVPYVYVYEPATGPHAGAYLQPRGDAPAPPKKPTGDQASQP